MDSPYGKVAPWIAAIVALLALGLTLLGLFYQYAVNKAATAQLVTDLKEDINKHLEKVETCDGRVAILQQQLLDEKYNNKILEFQLRAASCLPPRRVIYPTGNCTEH